MNLFETASYSWNLNRNKSMASQILQTIGATISYVFFCRSINLKEVETLISNNPAYKQCYFYKSLKNRKINISTTTLVIPKQYENHKRIAIDGNVNIIKGQFIDALRGDGADEYYEYDRCVFYVNPPDSVVFNILSDDVVLCELPTFISGEKNITNNYRYDDYNSVVITVKCTLYEEDTTLMKIAKNAGKSYLVVITNINDLLTHHHKNNHVDITDKTIRDEIINNHYQKITAELTELDLMPSNGKILQISGEEPRSFDFKEVLTLIKSQDFSGIDFK